MLVEQTKNCCRCGQEKILGEFRKDNRNKDGLRCECKDCSSRSQMLYENSERGKLRKKRYMQSEKGIQYELKRRQSLPYQVAEIVRRAIEKKEIARPEICPDCGRRISVEAHHEDYANPLDIMWFCRKCHNAFRNLKKRREYTHPFEFRNYSKEKIVYEKIQTKK